jgi:hypothetical protein
MLRHSLVGLTAMLMLFLVGCAGAQKGETQIKYESGHQAKIIAAPETGKYALYTMTDMTPQVVKRLEKGEQLGFEKTDDGQARAIAGDYSLVLPKSTKAAYWKLQTK